jgi:hypothetical protein
MMQKSSMHFHVTERATRSNSAFIESYTLSDTIARYRNSRTRMFVTPVAAVIRKPKFKGLLHGDKNHHENHRPEAVSDDFKLTLLRAYV